MAKTELISEQIPAREKERICMYMSGDFYVRLQRVIGYQHIKNGATMDTSPYLMNELVVPHVEMIEKKMKEAGL